MSDTFVDKAGRVRTRKTHCKYGHEFPVTARWVTNWKGYQCRWCDECARLRMQRKRENPEFKANEANKMRRWRAANPQKYKDASKRAYQKRDRWIQAFKVKCKHCPESRFPCLDFHHRESSEKMGTIGQIRHWPRKKLLEEIEKCDVVCANCHRWHHWEERQHKVSEGV